MQKLLEEIEANLATLRCRLEEKGIKAKSIETMFWNNSSGFKIGVWNDTDWLRDGYDYNHSIPKFCELVERRKILFRKFNGGEEWNN